MTGKDSSKPTAVELLLKGKATLREAKELSIDEDIEVEMSVETEFSIESKLDIDIKPEIEIERQEVKIPFEETKFGLIVKELEKRHKIDDWEATKRARALLKLPRKALKKLNKIDREILIEFDTP